MRWPRWAIPLPAIVLSFFPSVVFANVEPGLETTYYAIDVVPPVKSDSEYLVCGSEIENNINRNYDYELFEDCTYDLFMVHMTGFIQIPEHQTIKFMLASDDGGEITIGGNTFGNWADQGCSWSESGLLELEAISVPLNLWMYEHGGNSCLMLAWNIDSQGWVIVPDDAFTQQATASTTTTELSTTTTTTISPETSTSSTTTSISPETTSTTIESSTTILTSSTTTLPQETTTTTEQIQISTTTSTTSTTTTTTTTTQPATTTTETPYTPSQTSTTTPTTYPEPEPTTNETDTSISEPETSTTYLPDPVEDTVEPDETTIPDVVDATVPVEQEEPTTTEFQNPETSDTELEEVEDSLPDTLSQPDNAVEQVDNAVIGNIPTLELVEEDSEFVVDEIAAEFDIDLSEPLSEEQVDALFEGDLIGDELGAVLDEVFDDDLSDGETLVLAEILLDKPLSNDEFKTVVDAIFDEVVSDEVLVGVFKKILDTELSVERFANLVDVLETANAITSEQVATVVSLVLAQDDGISESQATELASSAVVLESVTGEQAAEVFDAIVASDLSVEQGSLIVEALLEASTEVKKSFEQEINVFEGVFDDYVATGSVVDVGTRRAIVAGVAIVFVAPMTPIPSGSSRVKS